MDIKATSMPNRRMVQHVQAGLAAVQCVSRDAAMAMMAEMPGRAPHDTRGARNHGAVDRADRTR
jgi:hypothetical protein